MAKRKAGSQIGSLTPDHKKSRIDSNFVHADEVRYTIGKLSTRATTLLQTSSRSEVWARSYGPQSCENPTLVVSGLPFRNPRTKRPFGCGPCEDAQRILYGGRWWLPLSLGRGESCESKVACGLSWHQRCCNIVLTKLWLVGCRSDWVNKLLVTLPSPILELQHAPLPL